MPQKETNQEINLFDGTSGARAYGKISWAPLADGTVWRLDREADWPNVKTAGQVVDMAKRFAAREGYKLEFRSETDSVWVKFTKVQETPEGTDSDPFQGEAAESQPEPVGASA